MNQGEWVYSDEHRHSGLLVERQEIWGHVACRVWLPATNEVVSVQPESLCRLGDNHAPSTDWLVYAATAARIQDALSQNILLAPMEAPVVPLPHQIKALSRAVSGDDVRYLLADEVGLGKTVEAGLILRELKLRGLVQRTVVVAPKGLTAQWAAEMRVHFGETFRVVLPEDLQTLRRMMAEDRLTWKAGGDAGAGNDLANVWRMFPQVIVPMDSVKPIEKRRGWSKNQLADYNRQRFDDLVAAGWDLVIVDEAHRLGGSTDQVARFRLGQGLSHASPYLLLLSATPHQGKTDAFRRVLSLLDGTAFPDDESVKRETVQQYVIRTEKRHATDADGKPLFRARTTTLSPVSWDSGHEDQRLLYEGVSAYVRGGYNLAIKEKRNYIGFLMILMQRLVTSSTRAVRAALERRLEVLKTPDAQLSFFDLLDPDEWSDMDGQAQLESLIQGRFQALRDEQREVKLLLDAACRVERRGPDAKAEELLRLIYHIQQEDGDPDVKLLIFTEFVPTQDMLTAFLQERGFKTVKINGSMSIEDRLRAQREFARSARVLVSTDAGGEGLNLQFCHVIVNFDLPWNPMKIEQRIGRVDRIGQVHDVRAVNFVLADTVEFRVREVLEEKLAVIQAEFGVDKTGDVLDSAEAARMFDALYAASIADPTGIEDRAESLTHEMRDHAKARQKATTVLGASEVVPPDQARRLRDHPMSHWVEQMTTSYLGSHGGSAARSEAGWQLQWPDGEEMGPVVFSTADAAAYPQSTQLTLESPRIRSIAAFSQRHVPGHPVPALFIKDMPPGVTGTWSLWRIEVTMGSWSKRCIMPMFHAADGKPLGPTARHVWDQVMAGQLELTADGEGAAAVDVEFLWQAAMENGRASYDDLVRQLRDRLRREKAKMKNSFAVRRRAIQRIGLPEVREHRRRALQREEREWEETVERSQRITPELTLLVAARIVSED